MLKDYIKQIRGVSYKPTDILDKNSNNAVPIVRANNIQERGLNFDDLVYIDKSKVKDEQYLQAGDIVICASSGSKDLVGKAAYCLENKKASFGAFCKVVRTSALHKKYLSHFFQSDRYRREISESSKGANINNIRNEDIDNLQIIVPSIEEQKRIADELDKVSGLIEKRQKQLEKLDLLIKSRFVEMFGDIGSGYAVWASKEGNELFKFSSGKFLEESLRKGQGVPVYGGNGIAWHTDRYLVNKPTIVIGRVGVYCGNVRLINEPAWITDNAIYIKEFRLNLFNLTFLVIYMSLIGFSKYADFSGQPKITQKPLEKQKYIVPPIELQNRFADFVENVERNKSKIKNSLDKLITLKKALMQKYFG